MRATRPTFVLTALVALALALTPLAGAGATTTLVEHTETLYIAAGCPEDTPGTCTSTRWLGTTPGDATSNFITSITPVDEVDYQTGGTLNWRDYNSDGSLREGGYRLRAGDVITATVELTSNGAAVMHTVHGQIRLRFGGPSVLLTAPEVVFTAVTPTETVQAVFEFEVPEERDGEILTGATFEVAVRGLNGGAGYINQQGGSTVVIPWVEEIEEIEEVEEIEE